MFKKLMCVALSLMMVLSTISVTGFAADYSNGNLVASHVTFTEDGKAVINVKNVASEGDAETAVFWLGEYTDGVLVESDFVSVPVGAGENYDLDLSVTKDENSVLKAYIWEDVVRGKAIAPAATYPSDSTEINYVTRNGEIWADFDADTLEYDLLLERTEFNVPQFAFYAKDNATIVMEPDEYAVGENYVVVNAPNGDMVVYTINISYKTPTVTFVTNPNDAIKYVTDDVVSHGDVIYTDRSTFRIGHVGDGLLGLNYFMVPTRTAAIENINKEPGTLFSFTADASATVYIVARKERANYVNAGWELISSGASATVNSQKTPMTTNDPDKPYWSSISQWATDAAAADWQNMQLNEDGSVKYIFKSDSEPNVPAMQYPSAFQAAYKKTFAFGEEIEIPTMGEARDYDFVVVEWGQPEPFDMTDDKLSALSYTVGEDTIDLDVTVEGDEDKVYNVDVPTGTEEIAAVKATLSTVYSKLEAPEGAVTLEDGKATVEIKVTSFDGANERTYTINFNELPAEPDDASIKELTYKVGDEEAVEIDLATGVDNRYAVTVPALTEASTIKVAAKATVGEGATVTVTDITEWTDYKATATVEVVAIDGTTTATYYVDFTVEKHISEQNNKIYNLTAVEKVKSEDNAYQTEEEAVAKLDYIAIGENLTSDSLCYYTHTNQKFGTVSDDMVGASYIRPYRNHSSFKTVDTAGPVTRTVEGGESKTSNFFNGGAGDFKATGYGFRTNQSLTKAWYVGEYSAQNGEPGWIEFNVSSDCTVVVGDVAGFGYPNLDKNLWKASDGTTNKLRGTSYYRTYKAGDLVQIPNYGIGGQLADETKVTYSYTDTDGNPQTYETTVGNDYFVWDEITIAVKWDVTYSSDNTLASVEVGGKAADLSAMTDNTITVIADATEGEVALEITANDAGAQVSAPATVAIGDTATITVTAEDGTVATYYIKVEPKDVKNADLKNLSYKIADGEWTAVEGFTADTLAYAVEDVAYVNGGASVEIKGEALSDASQISGTLTGTLTDAEQLSLTLTVTSEDGSATKSYSVTFTMAEKVFEAIVEATDEYKALFNDGKYTGGHVIKADVAPTFASGTQGISSWDENGIARHKTYSITVDGAAYTEGDTSEFKYSQAIAIKAEKEAEGSTVALTESGWSYADSKFTAEFSSAFNTSGHNFGPIGSAFRNANFQVMTHRAISPGRVDGEAAAFKDTAATKTWLRTDSNYLFTVTPNSKATVYVAMQQADAANHSQYIADGWTFIDSSYYFTQDTLDALPDEAIIEGFRSSARNWSMVEPSYILEEVPYSLIKVQYDTQSATNVQVYPYVWYKTVEEGETVSVPTVGSQARENDQQPIKAFIIEGEHQAWAPPAPPAGADATLKSLKVADKEITLTAGKYAYTVELPYGTTKAVVEAAANDENATVTAGTGEVNVADGDKITVTVTAQDGTTVQNYEITVSISNIPFRNLSGDDSNASKASNVYKVVAANDDECSIVMSTTVGDYATEAEAKAAYEARISAFNAKYGENAHWGTNMYAGYPGGKSAAGSTEGTYTYSFDNPNNFTNVDNPIMNGNSWVFKTTKGKNFANNPIQEGDDLAAFGDSAEWIKFDIDAPGMMYVIDVAGVGYPHEGWELQSWKMSNLPVYGKHFEAGTVVVPAMNTPWATLEAKMSSKRIPNTPGFIFTFDDISNAAVEEITYDVDGSKYTAAVSGDEITISVMPGAQKVTVISAKTAMADTKVAFPEIALTAGTGTGTLVATAPDGVTTKEYTVTVEPYEAYKIVNPTSNGSSWLSGIYGTKEVKSYGSRLVAIEGMSAADSGTINAWSDRPDKEKLVYNEYFNEATAVITPRQGADPKYKEIKAYRYDEVSETWVNDAQASFTRQVEGEEVENYTGAKINNSGSVGFRFSASGSLERPLFAGDFNGADDNWWITFIPTSDCTVVLGDDIELGWPSLDKTEWKSNTLYTYLSGKNAHTYAKHFKAGEVVKIPNYGIPEGKFAVPGSGKEYAYTDDRTVTYTYYDENGVQQTLTTKVYNEWQNWMNIGFAIVWDDKSVASDAKSISIGETAVEFDENNTAEYKLAAGATTVLDIVADETATVVITDATGAEKTEFAAGDVATVTITAADGKTKTVYTITFAALSNDATLKSAKAGDADVVFDANNSATVELEAGSEIPEVTYETNDLNAKAETATAENVVTITVTAEDGKTVKTYTINFTFKADSSLALSSVKVNDADATLTTKDGETYYYAEVASDVETATVLAAAEDENSNVSYSVESPVTLVAGEYTTLTITVASTSGETQEYTVKILRKVDTSIDDGTEDGGDL